MKLRTWQSACIDAAISKYKSVKKHFLALATPGAGKTVMASVLAKKLYDLDEIDLVLCFSPSSIVAHDFSTALSDQFDMHFDGTIGAIGNSYTYQGLNTLDGKIWRLFNKYRVFVIFDEIHHCAGSNTKDANTWGEAIITRIKDVATYTVALTGTPWRSDSLPIVLAEYCNRSGGIQCDFIYGLKEAIRDNVCRIPQVVALDNNRITVVEGNESTHFNNFSDLLSHSIIPYSEIVTNEMVIKQLLNNANAKLKEIRKVNHNAGGLIVASSIPHAWKIQLILKKISGETALVVTSKEEDANSLIQKYRYNEDKWVISVGMISEGTNIPRLQVCCYLSNIKTEMYYRQVLGRILRITTSSNQEAILFMPAEPSLVGYAYRLAQDIPEGLASIKITIIDEEITVDAIDIVEPEKIDTPNDAEEFPIEKSIIEISDTEFEAPDDIEPIVPVNFIMGIFGQFVHQELEIEGFENLVISDESMKKLDHYNSKAF